MRRIVGHVELHHTYKLISKTGTKTCTVWPTLRHERQVLRGLMLLWPSSLSAEDVFHHPGLRRLSFGIWSCGM